MRAVAKDAVIGFEDEIGVVIDFPVGAAREKAPDSSRMEQGGPCELHGFGAVAWLEADLKTFPIA